MKLTEFFNTDYVNQASYDNLRKIASVVDGQKNASRKILHTILEKNIKTKVKVSQLNSKVAEFSEYLHGSLESVIVNLGKTFAGTNNIPLMQKKGNFGTRFTHEASAPRYIYAYGSNDFFELFKKEDIGVLKHQTFEGVKIEPMFFTPNLPMLLVNGSEGVSSGFAQKILPRDPKTVKRFILNHLDGKKTPALTPHYSEFSGTIERGENDKQWIIKGCIERLSAGKIRITEIPVHYSLKSYIKILDGLEEKRIIKSYRDKSENDNFTFDVSISSESLKQWSDDTLITKLKLVKTVSENYTVIDENNKIVVHENANDVFHHYIRVKLQYMEMRRLNQLSLIQQQLDLANSKRVFIEMIIDNSLTINNRKKIDIESDLNAIEHILCVDGSYNYLLNMPIYSLTSEKVSSLTIEIESKKNEHESLSNLTASQMWKGELND